MGNDGINVTIHRLGKSCQITGDEGMTVRQALKKAEIQITGDLLVATKGQQVNMNHVLNNNDVLYVAVKVQGG